MHLFEHFCIGEAFLARNGPGALGNLSILRMHLR